VKDPFVGKLYNFAINHGTGLPLNKKANYLANQVKICNSAGKLTVNIRKLTKLLRPYLLTTKKLKKPQIYLIKC
jgi:hypothetical protein